MPIHLESDLIKLGFSRRFHNKNEDNMAGVSAASNLVDYQICTLKDLS